MLALCLMRRLLVTRFFCFAFAVALKDLRACLYGYVCVCVWACVSVRRTGLLECKVIFSCLLHFSRRFLCEFNKHLEQENEGEG